MLSWSASEPADDGATAAAADPTFRAGRPDLREIIFPHQSQQEWGILAVGLLLLDWLGLNLGGITRGEREHTFLVSCRPERALERHTTWTTLLILALGLGLILAGIAFFVSPPQP